MNSLSFFLNNIFAQRTPNSGASLTSPIPHPQGGYSGFQVTGMIEGFFWGLKFLIPGLFWVGKFGKYFLIIIIINLNLYRIVSIKIFNCALK